MVPRPGSRALPPTAIALSNTVAALLHRCSSLRHLNQIHAFMLPRGLHRDNHHLTKFIESCSDSGLHSYAYSVFTRNECPDLFLINTMISCLSQTDLAADAVFLFGGIRRMGFRPNSYSFPLVLKAASHLGLVELGRQIHSQTIRDGLCCDAYVGTGLVRMYSACGDVRDARKVFDSLSLGHVMLWNAMMAAYGKIGDMVSAREVFELMPGRNLVSWTTMITVLVKQRWSVDAIRLFWRMVIDDTIEPDEVALLAALSACADLGAVELGKWIHSYINIYRVCKTVPLMNSLIDMYFKSGYVKKALAVFESIQCKSVVSWTTVIAGLALHGLGVDALKMFHCMEESKIQPNEVTFLAILSACSHSGLLDAGIWYFNRMNSKYQIEPKIEHYGCMVDLLGRAGKLEEARALLEVMPYEPNAAIFGSLLNAATIHGNRALGEYALGRLIEVEPHNSGNYSLLSNLHSSKGNWSAAGNIRRLMKDSGIKKVRGGSSIELEGVVHQFIARDTSHLLSDRIYEVLYEVDGHLKMAEPCCMLFMYEGG